MTALDVTNGAATGVSGDVLGDDDAFAHVQAPDRRVEPDESHAADDEDHAVPPLRMMLRSIDITAVDRGARRVERWRPGR